MMVVTDKSEAPKQIKAKRPQLPMMHRTQSSRNQASWDIPSERFQKFKLCFPRTPCIENAHKQFFGIAK
jgi:hypothetical protein